MSLSKIGNAKWHVYIVRCIDDTLYTGVTVDINARIEKHNLGKGARYTRSRVPVTLVYSEAVQTRSAAQEREYAIKQLSRIEKLELVDSIFID